MIVLKRIMFILIFFAGHYAELKIGESTDDDNKLGEHNIKIFLAIVLIEVLRCITFCIFVGRLNWFPVWLAIIIGIIGVLVSSDFITGFLDYFVSGIVEKKTEKIRTRADRFKYGGILGDIVLDKGNRIARNKKAYKILMVSIVVIFILLYIIIPLFLRLRF